METLLSAYLHIPLISLCNDMLHWLTTFCTFGTCSFYLTRYLDNEAAKWSFRVKLHLLLPV